MDSPAFQTSRRMLALKTKEECRLGNETIQVWAVELPSKHAEGILKVIKDNVEGQDRIDLQHLRRFAKPKFLPKHILGERDRIKELHCVPRAWETSAPAVMQASCENAVWDWSTPAKARTTTRAQTLYLLICPTNVISMADLHSLLLDYTPFASSAESWAYPLVIKEVTVPLLSPTSPAQADEWSNKYWPTFYRKTNPFGAHPVSMSKAEDELQTSECNGFGVEHALELAEEVAQITKGEGLGVGTGCVIVERVEGKPEIIAVAGDARYKPLSVPAADEPHGCSPGNVMAHAAMRALGFVGRKRLRVASGQVSKAAAKAESNFANVGLAHDETARDGFFLDLPVNSFEQKYFDNDNIKPDGYLCLKLEVFLTHEPCMMCSMALVHSRVGRVIFKHRMPETGGLTAELVRNDTGPVGLGYGLCWRKELNWQFMCWEYIQQTHGESEADDTTAASTVSQYSKPPMANETIVESSFACIHV
ncbi:Hypothetical protein R9X50_00715100 [Acrodontium crateriforme]|uniref:CMP/dCMP-type deaminase domain-containing protein n=1 Tax=Acrodontium crateriforme TaxID=150365 RepID=A0AAQ3MDQ7_9PEZI|nr:Hypothetical protein R9X50_00715100 [Acrodontium crateriforme]